MENLFRYVTENKHITKATTIPSLPPYPDLSIQLPELHQPFRLIKQLLLWFLLQLWIKESELFRHLLK